jgi:hypothetical protein
MNDVVGPAELDDAIASLYAGPTEAFVGRRDALAKELRASGRREAAAGIKALRKPSKLAWALDVAVHDARDSFDRLSAAVTGILEAQSGAGDLRAAMGELRAAVRGFADDAARAAEERGQSVDQPTLVNAVLALIGDAASYEALRKGRLVDVPEAGGLDFLTSLPSPRPEASSAHTAESVVELRKDAAVSREALRQAETTWAAARERSAAAERAWRDAQANLERAEQQLRDAEDLVRSKRLERDRAAQAAKEAGAELRSAEKSAADARSAVESAGHGS